LELISPNDFISFTQLYAKELGFYLFETVDTLYTWRVEARFPHTRNNIESEIVIVNDILSPSSKLNKIQAQEKIDFIQNLIKQYLK
jgi:hypothetical protein